MNAFRFRLQRVLDFRRTQFQLAESAYQQAAANLQRIKIQLLALASTKMETRRSVTGLEEIGSGTLHSLTSWYRWTEGEKVRLTALERDAEREAARRREELIRAQGKVKLLEKLRDGRLTQWTAALDKEIEELAADSTSSRYSREASDARRKLT